MSLLNFLSNLNENKTWYATLNAGFFNVETGWASFRTTWVSQCDCALQVLEAIQYDCAICGRTKFNSLAIPSGDGDGLYTVVTLLNEDGFVFASLTLFDPKSKLAAKFIEEITNDQIRDLDSFATIFSKDLAGVEIGRLDSPNRTVFYSDNAAGIDSPDATLTIKSWVPGGLKVYAFVEDSLDNEMSKTAIMLGSSKENLNGGLSGSVRPRAILLLSESNKELMQNLTNDPNPIPDLPQQLLAWSKQTSFAQVGAKRNQAILWNGKLTNLYAYEAEQNGIDSTAYVVKEFSWYLQGFTLNDQECIQYVNDMIEQLETFRDTDMVQHAYLERGMLTKAKSLGPFPDWVRDRSYGLA
jgi:hypothetical protein